MDNLPRRKPYPPVVRLKDHSGADAEHPCFAHIHRSPRRDVRPEVEQDLELRTVAGLTLCEVESQRQPIEIGLEVDLGREAPAGAAQRLAILPPFAPAAETCARTMVESSI